MSFEETDTEKISNERSKTLEKSKSENFKEESDTNFRSTERGVKINPTLTGGNSLVTSEGQPLPYEPKAKRNSLEYIPEK